MIKDLTVQKLILLGGFCGGLLLHIDISDTVNFIARYISIISFVVILISNWFKFSKQVKYWIRKIKNK